MHDVKKQQSVDRHDLPLTGGRITETHAGRKTGGQMDREGEGEKHRHRVYLSRSVRVHSVVPSQ